jgi:hypothetical protein
MWLNWIWKMLILKRFVMKNYFFHVRIILMWKLRSLIFDCLSFTEGLITSLFTADGGAPASSRTFVTYVCPHCADRCRGVRPMIELNLQMFILKRFVMKNYFVHVSMQILMLNIFKNGENNISKRSCGIRF